jgi:outer membrane protein assembly factor BamE (lipoprotein component of BamABCDE complex)
MLAVMLVLVGFALFSGTGGATKKNFDKIVAGMTKNEVRAILGKPMLVVHNVQVWYTIEGFALVVYFDEDKVIHSIFDDSERLPIWERLRYLIR